MRSVGYHPLTKKKQPHLSTRLLKKNHLKTYVVATNPVTVIGAPLLIVPVSFPL